MTYSKIYKQQRITLNIQAVVYHIQNYRYLRFAQDNFFDNVMIYYEHVQ